MRRGLCILAAIALLSAGNPPAKDTQTKAGANQAKVQPAKPPELPYAAYPNLKSDACYNAKDHNAADLCAQWRAAIAAEKTAAEARRATTWAIVAAFVGAATLIGIIVSIWQTFGALSEARRGNLIAQRANARATRQAVANAAQTQFALSAANKSADAAVAQAKVAEAAYYRQLRAYISIEDVKIKSVSEKTIFGSVCVRNAGQTPATVKMFADAVISEWPAAALPEGTCPARWMESMPPYISAKGSDVVDWFFPIALEPAQMARAAQQMRQAIAQPTDFIVTLYGRIEFLDFMRRRRVLHFAYRNHGALAVGKSCEMVALPFGNFYEDCGIEQA